MKILLNIAGWFLYFVQWQKSLFYPCQFTLNSQSCQGSLYQGASNTHPFLNDSKATTPDCGLTTSVMHTQDTYMPVREILLLWLSLWSLRHSRILVLGTTFRVSQNFVVYRIHFGSDLSGPQLNADSTVLTFQVQWRNTGVGLLHGSKSLSIFSILQAVQKGWIQMWQDIQRTLCTMH